MSSRRWTLRLTSSRVRATAIPALLAIGSAAACGGDDARPSSSAATPPTLGGTSAHAIHVLISEPDGSQKHVAFGPATEMKLPAHASGASKSTSLFDLNLHPDTPLGPHLLSVDSGAPVSPAPTTDDPNGDFDATAWSLVVRAAASCGYEGMVNALFDFNFPWQGQNGPTTWYVYGVGSGPLFGSCAGRLAAEQSLLCTADKLAALADAVGTITWPGANPPKTYTSGAPAGDFMNTWIIPPQADADRFIVRDLAIHTLGLIPTLDSLADIEGVSCAQTFANVASGVQSVTPSNVNEVFGVGLSSPPSASPTYAEFPPYDTPIVDSSGVDHSRDIALSGLVIQAEILRSGGRLLHDVIRRDVYSDMAAAARQSSQALNPTAGNQNQWGLTPDGSYGSLAHAARVLMGRWELGDANDFPSTYQPECEGIPALGLLTSAMGTDSNARVADLPIRTQGEATAARLVEESGVVLPRCALPLVIDADAGGASMADIRGALMDELVTQEQIRNGLSQTELAGPRQIYGTVLGRLSDNELVFAFQRALITYHLLTNTGDPATCSTPYAPVAVPTLDKATNTLIALPAGLKEPRPRKDVAVIAPSVARLGGIVVDGGIARSRLATDPIARAGGILEASQCPEAAGASAWNEWGLPEGSFAGTTAPPFALPPANFQDAFHLGQAFERRLSVLRKLTAVPNIPSSNGSPEAIARGGLAELRSWAGATIVHAWPDDSSGTAPPPTFHVRIAGMAYSDLGLDASNASQAPDVLKQAIGFVFGPPWVAECAAHTRADCPADFETSYVQRATTVVDDSSTPGTLSQFTDEGVLGTVFELTVPTGGLANFSAPVPTPSVANASHLYMVRVSDPTNPGAKGRVMGVVSLRLSRMGHQVPGGGMIFPGVKSSFVDAPMQRELVHNAIDIGKWVGAAPPALGDQSLAATAGYCVDGVPRDLFVPLDNELTSSSTTYESSWQHYLDLAQQAANTADALGQQLIQNDLQISENEQSAAETLANICGDFGMLSNVSVGSDGTTHAGATDATTAACLNEPTTDIVFLGPFPDGYATSQNTTQFLKSQAVLDCDSARGTARYSPLCDKGTITAAELNITKPPKGKTGDPPKTTPLLSDVCSALQTTVPTVTSGFNGTGFRQVLGDPIFGLDAVESLAASLRMNVDLHNEWSVSYADRTIMSSTDPSYWPKCLDSSGCSALVPGTSAYAMAMLLNSTFRTCAAATAPLGCEGLAAGTPAPPPGGPPAPTTADGELNLLKWRVMQAMWLLGASAGQIAQGMFSLPVPVATLPSPLPPNAIPQYAGIPGQFSVIQGNCAVTSNGKPCACDSEGTLCEWSLSTASGVSSADVSTLGMIYDIDPRFAAFPASSGNEIPAWYQRFYQSGLAKHAYGTVTDLLFDHCEAGLLGLRSSSCADDKQPQAVPVSLASMVDLTRTTDGVSCPSPWGESGPPLMGSNDARTFPWWQEIGWLKTGMAPIRGDVQYVRGLGLWNADPPYLTGSSMWALYSPTQLGPWDRAPLFAGAAEGPNGTCGSIQLLLQAASLACVAPSMSFVGLTPSSPPKVSSVNDIIELESWLTLTSQVVVNSVNGLYAQSIPNRVIADFQSNKIGSGNVGGSKGAAILEMEQQLQALPSEWVQIGTDLFEIQSAIKTARLAITGAGLKERTAQGDLALQQIGVQGQMAQAVVGFLMTVASASAQSGTTLGASLGEIPIAAIGLAASLQTGMAELQQLNSLSDTAEQTAQNDVAQALAALGQTTAPLWADVQKSIDEARGTVAKVTEAAEQVQLAEGQAQYQAAIATGADFVTLSSGQEVPVAVNTVLRRQASATERRYQAALTNAKALAYMARRAIEQRIGVPLDAITTQVGPLAAPAAWADDICSLQGVNYAQLSTAALPGTVDGGVDGGGIGGSIDQQAISQFADSWVGDYVAKLQSFVQYYNTQYPSHQGSDTAVLSLRYDLLQSAGQCSAPSPNLLASSGSLDTTVPVSASVGWQMHPCDPGSGRCLTVVNGGVLAPPLDGPGEVAPVDAGAPGEFVDTATGISWLVDVPTSGTDAGADGAAAAPDAGATAAWPPNLVSQAVTLQPGTYLLSWWDQARDALRGTTQATGATGYVARVYDASWKAVATFYESPYGVTPGASLWSDRKVLSFSVTQPATYRIAFGASAGSGLGSVAIANVQLEHATTDGQPRPYVATDAAGSAPSYNCPPTDADLRAAFRRNCDSSGRCYYDLSVPVLIDTAAVNAGGEPLDGKLAAGNYNFRHGTTAVNLVGTGVHDCTNAATPNCYGSGYIEFSLQHDATNAGILDYSGNVRFFDFGVASVQHGKALALERYLTMPLSSTDQALVSQPGILHTEFSGRPLDGAYRLRIWDDPSLQWNRLEDVQILLGYDYWSQVQASEASATQRRNRVRFATHRRAVRL